MPTAPLTTIDTNKKCVKYSFSESQKSLPDYGKYKFLIWEFETPLMWNNILLLTFFHIVAVYASVTYPVFAKPKIFIYGYLIGFIGGFGITGGVHRYWTHKSYKAKLPLRIILLICFCVTGQNTLLEWVRDHRVHHKFSETNADPHNSKRGFFFAHVGWLMMKKHPDVLLRGRQVDMSDILEDPIVKFHQKHYLWMKLIFCFVIPTIIPPYLYGETWCASIVAICVVRYIVCLNLTWLVNSVAHMWGNKPYDRKIGPVENLTVSFFAMGEGYHNYHHTFPWDYRTAELGKTLNLTTLFLNFFEKIGWAYDLKAPSLELVKKVVENNGDGTHYRWGHEVSVEEHGNY